MAALDNDHLVVRVVYTGPPMAGKTQSIRTLMGLLRGKRAEQAVSSPGEWQGRTAFFDWADYEGGTYEGKSIRCQIMSTPGQVALGERRESIVRAADAVIMVVASQADAIERAAQCYEEMAPWLAEAGRKAPIRLILQCNKQDLPAAVPPDELVRTLKLPCGKDVYATSAHTGKGLRAAFVAGVRNAVERARALVAQGVVLGRPEVVSGHELFERMQQEALSLGSFAPASVAAVPACRPSPSQSAPDRPWPIKPAASKPAAVGRSVREAVASSRPAVSGATPGSQRTAAKPSRSGLFPALGSGAPARDSAAASAGSARSSKPAPAAPAAGSKVSSSAPSSASSSTAQSARPRSAPARTAVSGPASGRASPAAAGTNGRQEGRVIAARAAASPTPVVAAHTPAQASAAQALATVLAPARVDMLPASSARGAVAPPAAEPEPTRDVGVAEVQTPRQDDAGALDPSGAAARAERTVTGTRLAVMATAAPSATPSPETPSLETEAGPSRAVPVAAFPWRESERVPVAPRVSDVEPEAPLPRPRVMPLGASQTGAPAPDIVSADAASAPSAPARRELVDPRAFGLETSAFVDEPSESFRIPETPPGLQAFIAETARLPLSPAAAEPANEPGHEPPGLVHVAMNEPLAADAMPTEHGSAREQPGEDEARKGRLASLRAISLAAVAAKGAGVAAPFSFPGPYLPGQTRPPRAVWRRACWATLENQTTACASALQDARGRWIGELAPGWFARTLRSIPDERRARRALAEEVLRERKLARYLSRPRCVVLTEEPGGFWIWQVACRVPTLATVLRPRLAASEPSGAIADALLDAALGYLDAQRRFVEARVPLPLSPHALSFQDGRVVYSGLMPDPGAVFAEPAGNEYGAFQDALRKMWPGAPLDAMALLAELHDKAAGRLPEPLFEIIRSVVA